MVNLCGFFSFLSSVAGLIFFSSNPQVTLVCAAISLINSFIQVTFGSQNGFTTEAIAIVAGIAIALFTELPWYHSIALTICVEGVLLQIVGYIAVLVICFKKT